jgi:hypothetical protein
MSGRQPDLFTEAIGAECDPNDPQAELWTDGVWRMAEGWEPGAA